MGRWRMGLGSLAARAAGLARLAPLALAMGRAASLASGALGIGPGLPVSRLPMGCRSMNCLSMPARLRPFRRGARGRSVAGCGGGRLRTGRGRSGAAALGLRCLFLPPDRGPAPGRRSGFRHDSNSLVFSRRHWAKRVLGRHRSVMVLPRQGLPPRQTRLPVESNAPEPVNEGNQQVFHRLCAPAS
jgi:hypothetical protein